MFAVAATALVVWLVLSESGPASRGGTSRGADLGEEPSPKAPEKEGVGGPSPTTAPVSGRVFPFQGYVHDPGGAPVPGAVVRVTVQAGSVTDRTDAHGAYALEVPAPICTFDVWAFGYLPVAGTANGRSNGELDFVFDGEGPWRKDFTLRPAASLTGYVYDDAGQPVKGARVYVIPAEHELLDRETVANVVVSDEKGAFSFPGLPEGVTDLGARARGFLPQIVKDVAIPGGGTAKQDLRLVRGREIAVTVTPSLPAQLMPFVRVADSRLRAMLLPPGGLDALMDALVGRTRADYPVVAAPEPAETTGSDDATPGESRYRLAGVGPGPADIAARVLSLDWIVEPGLGERHDTTTPEVTLTLVRAILVQVNVRDSVTGNPLRPAVTRRTSGVADERPVEDASSFGRPESRELKSLLRVPADDRRHTLLFRLDGYQDARLDLPDLRPLGESAPSFDVAMQPTATGETGAFYVVFEPPLDGRVALVGRDSTGAQPWVKHIEDADKEGRWTVEEVPVGEYAVSVLATGMVPAFLPRVVVARGLKDTYRVTLTAGGGLALKVTDTDGQILDQVHLMLKDQAGNQIDIHVLSHVSEGRAFLSVNYLPSAASAKADSGLAAGFYEIAVYREGFEVGRKPFEVRGTDVAVVEIALSKAAPK